MELLTLYRRHTKTCVKSYPQNFRVHFPATNAEKAKDCHCPIAAEGMLANEGYLTNRSTKKTDWVSAQKVTSQWEAWGQTTPPVGTAVDNPTVKYAVDSFLASKGASGSNASDGTYTSFRVLLESRLIPYCKLHGYTLLREFDNLDVVTKFKESWVNLQPTRNRKDADESAEGKGIALGGAMQKAEVERLRSFFRYCVDRKWLNENHAISIKVKVKTAKKFGMEPHEVERVFAAIAKFDGGSYNAVEMNAFALVLRHAGLRMCDATELNDTQLVRQTDGEGWALNVFQKKNQEWVYIPMSSIIQKRRNLSIGPKA